MKKYIWSFFLVTALTTTAAWAQQSAPAPAPATGATPQKAKRTSVKKRVEIDPPATALVKGKVVNVRGQPSFIGEVLGHVQKDATVTVVEEITLNHPPAGEPALWYKILMPTNIPVWVKANYIDEATKSVKARRVNLRGGPGENFSVVARLEKGAVINEVRDQNGWAAIDAPSNAYAYVAAELLEIQAAPPAQAAAPAAAPPSAAVAESPQPAPAAPAPVAPAPTAQTEAEQELTALRQAVASEPPPGTVPVPGGTAAAAEPAVPRIVTREGFVHKAYNIQSPADYELHDIRSGELIEYLQPQGQLNFKMYVGTRITVTGPEVIDQRWPRTPILRVQSVDLMP
jgi:uncharacterized protein YgiM (DUF1202 family)